MWNSSLRIVSCLFYRKVPCDVQSVRLCERSVRWSQSGEKLREVANRRKSRKIGTLCGEKNISGFTIYGTSRLEADNPVSKTQNVIPQVYVTIPFMLLVKPYDDTVNLNFRS